MSTPTPASRFVVSGFADEVSPALETQLDVLSSVDVRHIDVRSVDDTNVLDLTDERLHEIRGTLDERGFEVASVGSPIGKTSIATDFDDHVARFERALEVASILDTDAVRLFSYFVPDGDDPAAHRDEVIRRMRRKAELAEEAGVTLLLENDEGLYGDTPERCRDVLTTVDSPNLRAVFDVGNFLELGVVPYPDAFVQLVEYVDCFHVKDAELGDRGEMLPAGEGDGRIAETLAACRKRGFVGVASVEPHLSEAGPASGATGADGFRRATRALQSTLDGIDADYE